MLQLNIFPDIKNNCMLLTWLFQEMLTIEAFFIACVKDCVTLHFMKIIQTLVALYLKYV